MRRLFIFFCLFLVSGFIILFCLNNTWIFQKTYDAAYWEDRYDTSQWTIPLSTRIIGDEGLYLHAGYRLLQGGDPMLINAETPPLGKYLVGLVTTQTNRPFLFGLIFYTAVLFLYYQLAKRILKTQMLAIAATTLVAVDPLIASQIPIVAMDIPYLLFLLLFFLSLGRYDVERKPMWILASGLTAGCFMAVKFPAFSVILVLIGGFVISKRFRFAHLVIFAIGMAFAYIASYFRFFMLGHTLIEFLKAQKWMIHFYQISNLRPSIGSVFSSIFFNQTQNLVTRQWEQGNQWSILWPILFIVFVFHLIRKKKTFLSETTTPISLFLIGSLLFYTFVPFWNRYLVLLVPFLYLLFFNVMQGKKPNTFILPISVVMILCNILTSILLFFPTPESDFHQFTYDWKYGFYSDMYERIEKNDLPYKQKEYQQIGRSIQSDLTIESITIHVLSDIRWKRFASHQTYPATIEYGTRELGTYTVPITIHAIKENGRWVFHWDWSYFGEKVTPQSIILASVDHATRGRILSSNGIILAEDRLGYALTLTPNAIRESDKETLFQTINLLHNPSRNDGLSYFDVQNRLTLYSTPDKPVFLSTIMKDPTDVETAELLETLQNYSGVTLIPTVYRWKRQPDNDVVGNIACATFQPYNLYFYVPTCDGNSGWEKERNEILKGKNGGTLTVISSTGERHMLIEQQKIDGQNVIINE